VERGHRPGGGRSGSDDAENPSPRRLILLSAGNIPDNSIAAEIADADAFPAEDPSQAWNALTIGGYTDKTEIGEAGYDSWTTMAPVGAASPYSRTSFLWDTSQSPFKPELVFEAGNRALSPCGAEAVAGLDSFLLAASRLVAQKPLDAFWATSAATAQAARMAAQLTAAYPHYWPETIRALMVHSARWTGHMYQLVAQCATKREKADCLRRFGYGIPDLGRAMASAIDDLALVAQNTIRPFRMEGGSVRFNESHIYQLPGPRTCLKHSTTLG
jgi:hypothetical protein